MEPARAGSMFYVPGMGFAMICILNNSHAMVQSSVPDALSGWVIGIYSLVLIGGVPVGSLMVGQLAQWTSAHAAAFTCAAVLLVLAGWIWFFRPQVRQMA